MLRSIVLALLFAYSFSACSEVERNRPAKKKNPEFIYRETIVQGSDTGMINFGSFRRRNVAEVLCQRWHIGDREYDERGVYQGTRNDRSLTDFMLFSDSSAILDPETTFQVGKWRLEAVDNRQLLVFNLPDNARLEYQIRNLSSKKMIVSNPRTTQITWIASGPGQVHANMYNDPFHPVNNEWRKKPSKAESESGIHKRLKNCLRFFALYYRDHIKRRGETISFEGIPRIFEWYNKGIGLPAEDEVSQSWINCFYNKEQAMQGYAILRRLIVDYEYAWPKGAPSWTYETHSVLEQMYHKIDVLNGKK